MKNGFEELDTSRPSREQLHEAYELARLVWSEAPWERMEERQVLAIRFADGRKGVVSVMGSEGCHFAIALYPLFASYVRIRSIDSRDVHSVGDAFFSTNQLQLAFGPARQMFEGEMKDLRASGVKFKRGMNPSFVSYFSGFAPDRMGGRELARYIAFLKAFRSFYAVHGPDAIAVNDAPRKLLTTWEENATGDWTKGEDEFSPLMPVAALLSDAQIERVAALPVEKEMALEIGVFPFGCGRAPNGRGKMSRCVLVVDGATKYCMGVKIIETPDDREFDWSPVVEFALDTMLKFGARPSHLAVFGCGTKGILDSLTRQYFKGTTFMPYNPCDSAHELFDTMQERL